MDYKACIAEKLSNVTGVDYDTILSSIEVPPQSQLGDYAFPCFVLSKVLRKAPAQIASELSSDPRLTNELISSIRSNGAYVNFFIDRGHLASGVISNINEKGMKFAESNEGEGKTIIVEFSSPNIAKPFHVGHAFTTILGHSLARIYETLGYNVIRMNHLGDYGTQFGKLITAYRLWGEQEALEKNPIQELLRIYVKFHDQEKNDPQLTDVARDNFRKLESGASEEMALWEKFKELSLKEFSNVYDKLGVQFDNYNGESFYSDRIPLVLELLRENNLLTESQGAQVVELEEYGLPPCIIIKSDGTTIYASRDIAAAMYRYEQYHFHKNLYVVGSPQALHFKQVFAVLDKAGKPYAKDCLHVGFGLVKFKDMKFSTREGNIVVLDDLLNESISKTQEIIRANAEARNTNMSDGQIAQIAEKVGIGAVIYTYVKSGRERDIIFSWDDMLDFEGDTAPYLIYTYARTKSILRKAESQGIDLTMPDQSVLSLLTSDDEFALIKILAEIPDAIAKAASSNEPFMVARQIAQTARAFNRFYNNTSIISGTDVVIRSARLSLCTAICHSIKLCTYLLGIEVVEQM